MNRFAALTARGKLALGAVAFTALAVPSVSAFATAEDPTAKLSAEQVEKGRQLFTDWSCGACHSFSDGGGAGSIGPALDGNSKLDHAYVVGIVTDGQGPMPSFGGQIPDEDIDLLAKYIVQAKK